MNKSISPVVILSLSKYGSRSLIAEAKEQYPDFNLPTALKWYKNLLVKAVLFSSCKEIADKANEKAIRVEQLLNIFTIRMN